LIEPNLDADPLAQFELKLPLLFGRRIAAQGLGA
jgi:hypothetical protein